MAKFILSYRSAPGYDALANPDDLAAWQTFLNDVIRPNVIDPGWPVFEPSTVLGAPLRETQAGGYSVIDAEDLDAAIAIAKQAPPVTRGGGVEVSVLAELPPEHPAEQMRRSLYKR